MTKLTRVTSEPITYKVIGKSSKREFESQALFSEVTQLLADNHLSQPSVFGRYSFFWQKLALAARSSKTIPRQVGLIVGPSGSGKTQGVISMAHYLNIPYAIIDLFDLLRSGYLAHLSKLVIDACRVSPSGKLSRILIFDNFECLINSNRSFNGFLLGHLLDFLIKPIEAVSENVNGEQFSVVLVGKFNTNASNAGASGFSTSSIESGLSRSGVPDEFLRLMTLPTVVHLMPTKKDFCEALRCKSFLNPMPNLIRPLVTTKVILTTKTIDRITSESVRRNLGYWGFHQVCEEVVFESVSALQNGETHI